MKVGNKVKILINDYACYGINQYDIGIIEEVTNFLANSNIILTVNFNGTSLYLDPSQIELEDEEIQSYGVSLPTGYSLAVDPVSPDAGRTIIFENDSKTECEHNWLTYQGLFETDVYCSKCNQKKKQ